MYSFYEQLGKEGLTTDLAEGDKNQALVGPGTVLRILAAGAWTNLLFMWPMAFFKLRHSAPGRVALGTMGAGAGFAVYSKLMTRAKL
jgi:hypothetical protein